ncbi:ABC transporter permease [Streptomyces sp. NPDC001212]
MKASRPLIAVRFHFASMWNWRQVYYGRLIEPLTYFIFLAVGVSGALASAGGEQGERYMAFVVPGMFALLAFRSATAAMADVSNDRKWGVFAFYRIYGGSPFGYILSILLVLDGMFLCQLLVILALASALGGLNHVSMADLFASICAAILVDFGWIAAGAAVGTKVQSYSTRNFIISVTTLPVVLAAPLFYPIDSAPVYLKIVAHADPLTYQVGWLRSIWSGSLIGLLWAATWAVVVSGIAITMLRTADLLTTER